MDPLPQVAPVDASNAPQQAVAEPMTDAEAEVVLVALGPPLEWQHRKRISTLLVPVNGSVAWMKSCVAQTQSGNKYNLFGGTENEESGTWTVSFFPSSDHEAGLTSLDEGRRDYKGLDVAKAACERHHVTGRWE